MEACATNQSGHHGEQKPFVDQSFAFLVGTTFAVFLLGNILLLSPVALLASAKVLGISLGCLAIIYTCIKITSDLAFSVVSLYLILSLPVITQIEALGIVYYAAALAAIGWIFRSVNWKTVFQGKFNLEVAAMSMAGAITILGVRFYTSFDMLERASAGNLHPDTLYHASLASMLKNYGVASTGLNGIVETPYHIFSHRLYGAISMLANVSVLETYGTASQLLFAPLLIYMIVFMANQVAPDKSIAASLLWTRCCLVITILPTLFWAWRFRNYYFVSESHMVSLIIFLACLTPLLRTKITTIDWIVIPLASFFMSQSKASVGGVYALLWIVSIFLVKGHKIRRHLFMAVLVLLCVYFGLAAAAEANQQDYIKLNPLHFIRILSLGGWYIGSVGDALRMRMFPSPLHVVLGLLALVSFLAFHFLPSWLFLFGKLRKIRLHEKLGGESTRAFAYVLVSTAVCIVIALVCEIPGGSVYYFSSVPVFVCLPFLLQYNDQDFPLKTFSPSIISQRLLLLLLLLFCLPGLAYNSRIEAMHRHGPRLSPLLQAMINIRESSPKNSVFIGTNELQNGNLVQRFSGRPFVFPALSERPWIDVIERQNLCLYEFYGYSEYGVSKSNCIGLNSPRIPRGFTLRSLPAH